MQPVLAYLDAGTGSLFLAAIASGGAGLWFFIRTRFRKVFRRGAADPTGADAASHSEGS